MGVSPWPSGAARNTPCEVTLVSRPRRVEEVHFALEEQEAVVDGCGACAAAPFGDDVVFGPVEPPRGLDASHLVCVGDEQVARLVQGELARRQPGDEVGDLGARPVHGSGCRYRGLAMGRQVSATWMEWVCWRQWTLLVFWARGVAAGAVVGGVVRAPHAEISPSAAAPHIVANMVRRAMPRVSHGSWRYHASSGPRTQPPLPENRPPFPTLIGQTCVSAHRCGFRRSTQHLV